MATILFVTYHFAPENTSGTHRSLHFARALMDAGHEVAVIAGPQPSASRSDPGLERVFPWRERVTRLDVPPSVGSLYLHLKRRGPTHRDELSNGAPPASNGARDPERRTPIAHLRHHVRTWDALPDHQRAWLRPAVRAGRELGRRIRADAVFSSGPPWTGVLAGHRIARALAVPFVADFRDPWSSRSGATWLQATAWAQRRVERWEATVLSEAAVVCFNSPRLAAVAAARSPLAGRLHVLLNGSDVPRQASPLVFPTTSPLRFRHFGSLYAGRSIEPLVDGLERLIATGALEAHEVDVELVGDADPRLSNTSRLLHSPVPVRFVPPLAFGEASRWMGQPCVLVSIQSEEHANLIPTKLFDYLCTGNPVLVQSPEASASWDVAGRFGRCTRLDPEPSEANCAALASLVAAWRRGTLHQECSVADTEEFAKRRIGGAFTRLVEDVVAGG